MIFANFKDKLCRKIFLGEDVVLPVALYLGFSKTEPARDGSNISEPTEESGYTRMPLSGLTTSGSGIAVNLNAIEYPTATASWGQLKWCVLFDQDGIALSAQELDAPIFVETNETVILKAGEVRLWFGEDMVIA